MVDGDTFLTKYQYKNCFFSVIFKKNIKIDGFDLI